MKIDTQDTLSSILDSISKIDYIKPEEIPNIDLYMDQVTTFMEKNLQTSKRYETDKILTKTMINNYAKNDLLPPPLKKKYSKEHVLLLIFIYYFKGILSFNDIQELLNPITELYFQGHDSFKLEDIYREVFRLEQPQIEKLKNDLSEKYDIASSTFLFAPEKDRDMLQRFAFICLLSFDVYVKKQLIEKLIDSEKTEDKKTKK